MPDVTGMGLKDAVYLLEQNGLRVTAHGKGSVISQSIQPGSPVTKGNRVAIDLQPNRKLKKRQFKPEA